MFKMDFRSGAHKTLNSNSLNDGTVYVYAAIDVSGSMRGSKIEQVCSSITDIIGSCPDQVFFDITLFHNQAYKINCSMRGKINTFEIAEQLRNAVKVGQTTALYDTWGELVTSIPETVLRNSSDEIRIFVLTDGDDNASRHHSLNSVLEATKRMLRPNVHFRLIQVGAIGNPALDNGLKTLAASTSQFKTQSVQNSAQGIQYGLGSVKADILLSTQRTSSRHKATGSQQGQVNMSSLLSTTKRNPTLSSARVSSSAGGAARLHTTPSNSSQNNANMNSLLSTTKRNPTSSSTTARLTSTSTLKSSSGAPDLLSSSKSQRSYQLK